jgi:myosin heavy subunit
MEIGKNPELQPTETAEQTKNSETITESLTQPSKTPEESPIKLKVERDILVQSFEKAKEFMRTQKKQIQTLEEEKQTILSDRQRLREEVRKSTVEIQCLTTELSETQKLNQSLQQSNDDLRNRKSV